MPGAMAFVGNAGSFDVSSRRPSSRGTAPLRFGETVDIDCSVERWGTTSFDVALPAAPSPATERFDVLSTYVNVAPGHAHAGAGRRRRAVGARRRVLTRSTRSAPVQPAPVGVGVGDVPRVAAAAAPPHDDDRRRLLRARRAGGIPGSSGHNAGLSAITQLRSARRRRPDRARRRTAGARRRRGSSAPSSSSRPGGPTRPASSHEVGRRTRRRRRGARRRRPRLAISIAARRRSKRSTWSGHTHASSHRACAGSLTSIGLVSRPIAATIGGPWPGTGTSPRVAARDRHGRAGSPARHRGRRRSRSAGSAG